MKSIFLTRLQILFLGCTIMKMKFGMKFIGRESEVKL